MRDVLGRMFAGAASRIFDSANPREIKSLTEGCVHCSEDNRGHSDRDKGAPISQWIPRGPGCQRISMKQYASSPRKENCGYKRQEERDYKGLQRTRAALPVWSAHQLHRFPGKTSVRGPTVV